MALEVLVTSFQMILGFYVVHAKHAIARGSGGMPPRKILKIAYPQTDFNGNFAQKSSSNTPLNTMRIDSLLAEFVL